MSDNDEDAICNRIIPVPHSRFSGARYGILGKATETPKPEGKIDVVLKMTFGHAVKILPSMSLTTYN